MLYRANVDLSGQQYNVCQIIIKVICNAYVFFPVNTHTSGCLFEIFSCGSFMENPLNPIRWSGHLSVCSSVSTPFSISYLNKFYEFSSTFTETFLSGLSVMGL